MGLQGNKATHDFLSLYTAAAAKDSSLPGSNPKPPPPPATPPPTQGFFPTTHDFLQPLERPSSPPPPPQRPSSAASANKPPHSSQQQALPGGVGSFSISHAVAVKQEPHFPLWGAQAAAAAAADPRGHQWALPFTARTVGVASSRSKQQQPERKGAGFMDAASGSSAGAGFDDEDGLAARGREVSSSLKELTVRVEGKGGSCSGSAGTDQVPNTPRSKHSATEQRRRSKINDRFQLLRELLPQNDQKRDKASFLLEVIEYIRFLQEKVQKYEVSYPECSQENGKIMPWSNVYVRSVWKNAQNKDQIPGDTLPDPAQLTKNGFSSGFPYTEEPHDNNNVVGFSSGFPYTEEPHDNNNVVASAAVSGAHDQADIDRMGPMSYKSTESPSPTDVADNVASQREAHLTRSPAAEDDGINNELLSNPEFAIEEGTINLSSQYSKELLISLNHALQNSGIDLSQASISVQINLGKRGVRSDPAATTTSKELVDPASKSQTINHHLRLGDGPQEHLRATKRRKSDNT